MASGVLADYGADVITVVEPGYIKKRGGPDAPARLSVNLRNKRSLNLNLRANGGQEVFLKLADSADAIIESNRPGVAERLGIDYETVRARNPGVIYCSLSGFGQRGPYSGIAAHDLSYQGVSGMLPQDEEGKPFAPPYNQADLNASWFGAMSILMALLRRTKDGQGQYIDVAFADVAVTIPPGGVQDWTLRGTDPAYNVYETSDGRYLTLSIREPWFWQRFCKLLGKEEWIGSPRPKGALRDQMHTTIAQTIKTKPLGHWLEALRENDQQYGPVNRTVQDLAADPHLEAREMLLKVTHPVTGKERYEPGFALKFSRTPATLRNGPTIMGEDTAVILQELGYDQDQIMALNESGVTAEPAL